MMRRAISLARRGKGKTAPNPAVGCVVVRDGNIVGEGWHRKAGTPHAEVHALAQAGTQARGADVYVTLEPCSHHGKTPPCADALIGAGVNRVFVGMIDPNPVVRGNGIGKLREAGIEVEVGLLEDRCRCLNEPFIKHIATGMPFVVLKCALTLDGRIATAAGDSRWISNERSRRYVHRLRSMVDAIMVGSGTVLADDPQLTCRIRGGKDPIRVVVDSTLQTSPTARIFGCSSAPALVATISADAARADALRGTGAEIVICKDRNGRVDLYDLLRTLGRRGVQSVLLEGGSTLAGEALRSDLIDKIMFFIAPKMVGGDGPGPFSGSGAERMDQTFRLHSPQFRRFGDDILVSGYVERPCLPA